MKLKLKMDAKKTFTLSRDEVERLARIIYPCTKTGDPSRDPDAPCCPEYDVSQWCDACEHQDVLTGQWHHWHYRAPEGAAFDLRAIRAEAKHLYALMDSALEEAGLSWSEVLVLI